MPLEWSDAGQSAKEVTERSFVVTENGRSVPGVLWTPETPREDSPPLVLIGHGGSGQKRDPHIVSLARRLARHNGIASAAIDGPVHGDRRPAGGEDMSSREARRRYLANTTTDDMVADWKATLDGLVKHGSGASRVGYWGLSMGTVFGLPFVAAEARISVAVLGLMGTSVPTGPRLLRDARLLQCPVLFLQQWDDELIPREASSELFGAIATADKRLHANPGAHAAVPREEFQSTQAFLAEHLTRS